jgi:RES domain-containing protein
VTVAVYRIAKLRYQDQIFAGLGGLYAQGRWTLRGWPLVYTSATISLAVLEYTANYKRRGWVPASILGRATIPDEVPIDVVELNGLPRRWADPDPPAALRKIGQEWLQRGATAVLKVPSAVVVEEWNYLLNPRHSDFNKLVIGESQRFQFDRRIVRARGK